MRKLVHFPEQYNAFQSLDGPDRNRKFFFGKIGRFLGGAAKGIVKGVGKAVKGIPVIGQVLTIGESAVAGAFRRTGAAVQGQLLTEQAAQRGFQGQQNVGLGLSLGSGALLQNPLILVAGAGLVLFFLLRKK